LLEGMHVPGAHIEEVLSVTSKWGFECNE
jgi:hypothetical protein